MTDHDRHSRTLRELRRRIERRIASRLSSMPPKPIHVERAEVSAIEWALRELGHVEEMRARIRKLGAG